MLCLSLQSPFINFKSFLKHIMTLKCSHFTKRTSGDEVCKKHVCTEPLDQNVIYSNVTRKEQAAEAKTEHRLHIFHPARVRFSTPLQKCTHCLSIHFVYVLLWTCTRLQEQLHQTSKRVIIPLKHISLYKANDYGIVNVSPNVATRSKNTK